MSQQQKPPSTQNSTRPSKQNAPKPQQSTLKERERQHEARKAAQKSLKLQKQAKELINAAAGATDPDERQKLLQQALEKEVEAGTFGKTARYLNTGEFQGLCAGAGLGAGIGVTLGTLTGTIVGGTTGTITGGLGAGIGLAVGAAHGPWFSLPKVMADGVRKITGDIPGWKATEEQKAALEKMVNGVNKQDRPPEQELLEMSELGESGPVLKAGKGYTGQREADEGEKGIMQGGMPSMPYVPGITSKSKTQDKPTGSKVEQNPGPTAQQASKMKEGYGEFAGEGVKSNATPKQKPQRPSNAGRTQSRTSSASAAPSASSASRRSSRVQQQDQSTPVLRKSGAQPSQPKKKPRKLEVRSSAAGTKPDS